MGTAGIGCGVRRDPGTPKATRWVGGGGAPCCGFHPITRGRGGLIATNYPLGAGRRHVVGCGGGLCPFMSTGSCFPLPCTARGHEWGRPTAPTVRGGSWSRRSQLPTRDPTDTRGYDCNRLPASWGGSPPPPTDTRESVPDSRHPVETPGALNPTPTFTPQTRVGGPRNPLPTPLEPQAEAQNTGTGSPEPDHHVTHSRYPEPPPPPGSHVRSSRSGADGVKPGGGIPPGTARRCGPGRPSS